MNKNCNSLRNFFPGVGIFSIGAILFLGIFSMQSLAMSQSLAPCHCRASQKDYDRSKGYYYDRLVWTPLPHVTARFGCVYQCADAQGEISFATYVHSETHLGFRTGGPTSARKFICDYSIGQFIPRTDLMGQTVYYETRPYGDFPVTAFQRPEMKEWARNKSCQ